YTCVAYRLVDRFGPQYHAIDVVVALLNPRKDIGEVFDVLIQLAVVELELFNLVFEDEFARRLEVVVVKDDKAYSHHHRKGKKSQSVEDDVAFARSNTLILACLGVVIIFDPCHTSAL